MVEEKKPWSPADALKNAPSFEFGTKKSSNILNSGTREKETGFDFRKSQKTGEKNWIENIIDKVGDRLVKPQLEKVGDKLKEEPDAKTRNLLNRARMALFFVGLQVIALYFLYGSSFMVAPIVNMLAIYLGIYVVSMLVIFKAPSVEQMAQVQLPDCQACVERMKRIFSSTPQAVRAEQGLPIWNQIILTPQHYKEKRSDPNYWKCAYCKAINPTEGTARCLNCNALRQEIPRKEAT